MSFMGCGGDTLPPLILILDNKDSFVWNLAQALMAQGQEVRVQRSDRITVEEAGDCDALVLSPGPGRPEDAGMCIEVVRTWSGSRPILGVCLGHQAIAMAFGGEVVRGEPCHGRSSNVWHHGRGIYRGLPEPMAACRYHSLHAPRASLAAPLMIDAFTTEGVVMGVHHQEHPTWGVQFHPESFRTPAGPQLLRNFVQEIR
jgi:anthranilate synthase/aminodeoxychorismate synthase-like glutamine amidotransferase